VTDVFSTGQSLQIVQQVERWLKEQAPAFVAHDDSPRTVGDRIQARLSARWGEMLGTLARTYSSGGTRQAMADMSFEDWHGAHDLVDVKTHRVDAAFSMPNLTSVERLTRLYDNSSQFFTLLWVDYATDFGSIRIEQVRFFPIEALSWDCLTIGALGWGQIQIRRGGDLIVEENFDRQAWMLALCERMLAFYPKEIRKIQERQRYFEAVKKRWDR